MEKCLIGPNASIINGILNAIKYAEYIDGNTLQIFLGNNKAIDLGKKTKITDEQIVEVKKHINTTKTILVIHTAYVLNFCNYPPTSSAIKSVLNNLIYDIKLTGKLGGIGCVLHIGYKKDLDENEAYYNMVENVKYAIDNTKEYKSVKVILETPAGKGSQIGTSLLEFTRIWNAFPKSYHSRLGICVDTAHIFSSGEDISTIKGTKNYFTKFHKLIGLNNLTLFHINDSKEICNSRKDRHEGLGDGFIYGKDKGGDLLALKEIYMISKKYSIPMVLETHSGGYFNASKDEGKYAQEIALFRGWDKNEKPEIGFKLKVKPISDPNKRKGKGKRKGKSISKQIFKINKRIIDIFEKLSYYYNIEKNTIRKNAYDKAIFQLKRLPYEIKEGKQLKDIDGIGKKMIDKIDEIIKTNQLETLNKLKKQYNNIEDIDDNNYNNLNKVLGFGDKKIKQLADNFKIKSIEDINKYLIKNPINIDNKLKLTNQQYIGIKYHKELSETIKRNEAEKIVNKINKILTETKNKIIIDGKITVELAGSFASKLIKQSKDIDILIKSNKYKTKLEIENSSPSLMKEIIKELSTVNMLITDIISLGKTKLLGIVQLNKKSIHRHLDIRLVGSDSYIFAKLYYTSGAMFNKLMRTIAKKNKVKLNEWGLYDESGKLIKGIKTEKDIFKKIGMKYIVLEERR